MDRRTFLKASVLTAGAIAVPAVFFKNGQAMASPEVFDSPLSIPPILPGQVDGDVNVFRLALQHGESEFFRGFKTPTLGINGPFLGPVLRVQKGQRVAIEVNNHLEEPSTLHWHGLKLPGEMDGGPHQVIRPDETWRPEFRIEQAASTQWYHAHAWHRTGDQVYRGLAGLFYIDDEHAGQLGLPNDYGVDDIPLVLQDRSFNKDGSFRYVSGMHQRMAGILGNVLLVNGTVGPYFRATKKRLRFRLLNGSNARIYNLAFHDRRKFHQVATDGGLLENPVELASLRLAPGERAEIIVETLPGEELFLQHHPLSVQSSGMMAMTAGMDADTFDILRISAEHKNEETTPLPGQLATVPRLETGNSVVIRQFYLDTQMMVGSTINGQQMDLARIDHVVPRGTVEIWEFANRSPMPHPMHIHGVQFQILSRNGNPPPVNESGLKDTVLVEADEVVRLVARFDHLADADHPFMFHCHNLEHEDAGMMGQFTVANMALA